MSVLFNFGTVWLREEVIVDNMKDVAADIRAWRAYREMSPEVKANFLIALNMEIVVPMDNVIKVSEPPRNVPNPVHRPTPVRIPTPQRLNGTIVRDAGMFVNWLTAQGTLVGNNEGLVFNPGGAYALSDGTVSVPINILRNQAPCQGTDFVFHFHPGVKGARVGHANASKGHFKPRDGAAKHIRMTEHQARQHPTLNQLWKAGRQLARAHR